VAVAVGLRHTAALVRILGRTAEAVTYERHLADLQAAINRHLWNDAKPSYFNYDVRTRPQRERMLCTTFDPLRIRLAPPERVGELLRILTNPEIFNWGRIGVTSMARNDPECIEHVGCYRWQAWLGDVVGGPQGPCHGTAGGGTRRLHCQRGTDGALPHERRSRLNGGLMSRHVAPLGS
jgi:hypothetical protein